MSEEITKSQNAIATAEKTKTLQDWLNDANFQNRISDCLNNSINPKQFLAISLNAVNKIPKLKQATIPSLLSCFVKCAELQLLPDGVRCHILPYEDKRKKIVNAQFILGYQGMVDLVYRKCNILLSAVDVRTNDKITSTNGVWTHTITNPLKKQRGEVVGYICFANLPDGRVKSDFIDIDEVETIKKKSMSFKYAESTGAKDSVWHLNADEMGKKTIIRRIFKTLPLSVEIQQAIKEDDEVEFAPQVEIVPPAPKLFANVSPEVEIETEEQGDVID